MSSGRPVLNGYADLAGIERPVIEHFSQRRAEIVGGDGRARHQLPGRRRSRRLPHPRCQGLRVDPDTQREEWIARAAEFDLTPESIDRMVARGSPPRAPRDQRRSTSTGALADLEAHHSHFDRRDLLCAVANQLPEGADAGALEAAVGSLLDGKRLIEIHRGDGPLDPTYYTTPRSGRWSSASSRRRGRGRELGRRWSTSATLAAVLDRHRYLSGEQVEMVRRLTTGGERVVAVAALPGAGKTTALAAAQEAWAAAGIRGIGVATARSASGELSDAGIPATSITAFLIRDRRAGRAWRRPAAPRHGDPSWTSPPPRRPRTMAALADLAEGCDGKLVLIGDPRQIGAVGPGGLYGNLTNEIEPIVLSEIRRQRDPVDRRNRRTRPRRSRLGRARRAARHTTAS